MKKAIIIKIISNRYTILNEENEELIAQGSGKLKFNSLPLVGDHIEYELREDVYMMTKVLSRHNEMSRPSIANVDQALIVMSAVKPDFSTQLVDRFVWLVRNANIEPVLIVTKLDLVPDDSPIYNDLHQYEKDGMRVIRVARGKEIIGLEDAIKDKISVLTGQSGVGKSSLLNRLNPDFVLRTQEISKALGRGKHTTRHVQLFPIAGGWVADTPGFSSLEFASIELDQLSYLVKEFDPYRETCQFRDCSHVNEPKCAVKDAVKANLIHPDRYTHYLEVRQLIIDERKSYK
jgi:ribosome biogenesis GTPase